MVSLDPKLRQEYGVFAGQKVNGVNPFTPQAASFQNPEEAVSSIGFSDRHGKGMAAGSLSNGVHGEVTGTGDNGRHKLNMYMWLEIR